MDALTIKTRKEIEIMAEGGKKLRKIKNILEDKVKEGENAFKVEQLAVQLIKEEDGQPSFMMVPGYYWATCVNVNAGLVHGIPKKEVVFKKGDLVSIDVGIYFKGFHTDTSISLGIEPQEETSKFLEAGKEALEDAIKKCRPGNKIYDISGAIQDRIEKSGYSVVKALVGHGVGKNLHEDPQIPLFRIGDREHSPSIGPGMALAIEVMYTQGSSDVVLEKDGWTISTRDGKISALFEETVAVTSQGSLVLT
jgi:methionyl aminopeptidase